MAKTAVKMAALGTGGKVVTGTFSYPTANAETVVTVDGLTQIDELIVYYTGDPSYSCSAFKVNGTFYANNASGNPTKNKVTDISGNTFDFYWQSAQTASTAFTYIAIQN